jgi:hypothetical protein
LPNNKNKKMRCSAYIPTISIPDMMEKSTTDNITNDAGITVQIPIRNSSVMNKLAIETGGSAIVFNANDDISTPVTITIH